MNGGLLILINSKLLTIKFEVQQRCLKSKFEKVKYFAKIGCTSFSCSTTNTPSTIPLTDYFNCPVQVVTRLLFVVPLKGAGPIGSCLHCLMVNSALIYFVQPKFQGYLFLIPSI